MSVTFSIDGAPVEMVEQDCSICHGTGSDGEDVCIEGSGPCLYCNGTGKEIEQRSLWPELNLSNLNARNILDALGAPYEDDLAGAWDAAAIAKVQASAIRVLNTGAKKALEVPAVRTGNYFIGGRDEEYVNDRLTRLLELLAKATIEGRDVIFG